MNLNNSSAWQAVTKQLKADRADLVEQLIKTADQRDTDMLRGKIQQIDDICEGYPLRLSKTDT